MMILILRLNLKNSTILKPIKQYERELSLNYQTNFNNIKSAQNDEKQKLIELIKKAEEKLIHENRKKIQTKMLFDNIVLKGVSEMNLKALSLSNEALKGKKFIT